MKKASKQGAGLPALTSIQLNGLQGPLGSQSRCWRQTRMARVWSHNFDRIVKNENVNAEKSSKQKRDLQSSANLCIHGSDSCACPITGTCCACKGKTTKSHQFPVFGCYCRFTGLQGCFQQTQNPSILCPRYATRISVSPRTISLPLNSNNRCLYAWS